MSAEKRGPSLFGRWAALQDETYWVPLKGIVRRLADTFGMHPEAAGDLIADGLASGTIAAIDPASGRVPVLFQAFWDNSIDWKEGELRQPGLPPLPLAVHWPDVERAIKARTDSRTIEGEPVVAAIAPPTAAPDAPTRNGRPPTYDWIALDAALAVWLCDNGIPETQAEVERWAIAWFPPERQPSESQVRERVKRAIAARRKADAVAKAEK